MYCKVVIRLLDAKDTLLGWAEARAHARGDGKLWIEEATVNVAITESGIWEITSAHWADVNIEVRTMVPQHGVEVTKGAIVPLKGPWPVFSLGEPAGGLPPVTVGNNVSISVPAGNISAVGNRG